MTVTTSPVAAANAVRLVLNANVRGEVWTSELIVSKVRAVLGFLGQLGEEVPDEGEVVRQIEASVNVWQPAPSSITDRAGHEEWLLERKATAAWPFWDRYRRYLEDVQLQPRAVIRRLDDVTDDILRKLDAPDRPGEWDRRGLVVGQVQSGKTSNYTGLICKAADAGYKLILVLAGIHNSLRSQTQLRLDEGFLGFDTQYQQRSDQESNEHHIGVGAMPDFPRLYAASLTNSAESGDFKDSRARNLALPVGDYPVVLVVKKHAGILENIHTWVTGMHGTADANGKKVVRDIPLLVIDDEADNASIDTSKRRADRDTDPTKVNRRIRDLLNSFAKSAYVGYTATPFANLYVGAYEDHKDYGEDIFPRSFIDILQPPSNYLGPERVFGLGDQGEPPLPIYRQIRDQIAWMPPKHDKYWTPPASLPDSLRTALRSFVLVCAARRARGNTTAHNSMLVHVSRFQDVQVKVGDQLRDHLSVMKNRLRYGDGDRPTRLLTELEQLWQDDFVTTSGRFPQQEGRTAGWDEVAAELLPAIEKIEMRIMNGKAKDALEYYERRKDGLSVVAVGGDKLSRGLTLEGLSVSYYLRASKMYDTLMQMGRWFGYRPGYEDLCRLYTTKELHGWYREITMASNELRLELEEMAAQGATPWQYGLRVRASAAGLSITAANKMRGAQRVRLSFSGGIPETISFDVREAALKANRQALASLHTTLDGRAEPQTTRSKNLLWRGAPADDVVKFLEGYRGDAGAVRSRPDLIASYIRHCRTRGELGKWDVLIVNNQSNLSEAPYNLGSRTIGMTVRDLLSEQKGAAERCDVIRAEGRYAIRRLLSPTDELQNLDQQQVQNALEQTIEAWRRDPGKREEPTLPAGPFLRRQRRDDQALLIVYVLDNSKYADAVTQPMVGFAISFPVSSHNVVAEYAVNEVWQKLQLQDVEDDLDDDADD